MLSHRAQADLGVGRRHHNTHQRAKAEYTLPRHSLHSIGRLR